MALLFLLNGKEPMLAAAEAAAALHPRDWWRHVPPASEGFAFFPAARKAPTGLGLAHRAVLTAFAVQDGGDDALLAALDRAPWARIIRDRRFRVRLERIGMTGGPSERDLAARIIARVPNSRIDLHTPEITIDIVRSSERSFGGVRVWENTETWRARRVHLWTRPHPTGLDPTVARALVRLAGAHRIHDPCCGAGGLLIEAGLLGLRVSGADIDPMMLARARENTRSLRLRPELRVEDATHWIPRVGAIVTDLPYGRGTRPVEIERFVRALLARAGRSTSRAVLGASAPLPAVPGWAVRARFTSYVHKSLTRHFTVLERVRA